MAPIDKVARHAVGHGRPGARSIDRCRRDAGIGIGSVQGARVAVRENKKEMGELRLADRSACVCRRHGGGSVSVVASGSSNETPGARGTCLLIDIGSCHQPVPHRSGEYIARGDGRRRCRFLVAPVVRRKGSDSAWKLPRKIPIRARLLSGAVQIQ